MHWALTFIALGVLGCDGLNGAAPSATDAGTSGLDWTPMDSPSTFTDNGNGTVTDSRNGLVWQQTVDAGTYTWAAAKTHCSDLSLAGAGWRLPSKGELESIVDFGKYNPAIDATVFPSTPTDAFWSSSAYVGAEGEAWRVHFIVGSAVNDDATLIARVRCVRSAATATASTGTAGTPPARYTIDATNGTVLDTRTNLTWQRAVDGNTYKEANAVTYCAALALAGGGWRLPKVSELLSLVDPTGYNPAIDTTAFPNTPAMWFWSSSAYVGAADSAWYVTFYYGYSAISPTSSEPRVRCVR